MGLGSSRNRADRASQKKAPAEPPASRAHRRRLRLAQLLRGRAPALVRRHQQTARQPRSGYLLLRPAARRQLLGQPAADRRTSAWPLLAQQPRMRGLGSLGSSELRRRAWRAGVAAACGFESACRRSPAGSDGGSLFHCPGGQSGRSLGRHRTWEALMEGPALKGRLAKARHAPYQRWSGEIQPGDAFPSPVGRADLDAVHRNRICRPMPLDPVASSAEGLKNYRLLALMFRGSQQVGSVIKDHPRQGAPAGYH